MRVPAIVDLTWAAALAIVLLIGYGVIPSPRVREPTDTFSDEGGGKRAFYLLSEALLGRVSRSTQSFVPDDADVDTLVMLGPARYPDRAQWETLHDWVAEGHALVFAARHTDPAVRLEPFELEVIPAPESERSLETASFAEERSPSLLSGAGIDGETTTWASAGRVVSRTSDVVVELAFDDEAQVAWRPIGDGAIVVVASDRPFTNRALARGDLGVLAFRILETAAPMGAVYFDETMNGAGAPRVVGVLFEPPLRLVTLQILVLGLLFAWMASRRFGPLTRDVDAPRKSLVEHARALGALHFAAGDGSRLLSSYLELFRRELGTAKVPAMTHETERTHARPEPAAALDEALRAVDRGGLPRGQTARILTRLARLRRDGRATP